MFVWRRTYNYDVKCSSERQLWLTLTSYQSGGDRSTCLTKLWTNSFKSLALSLRIYNMLVETYQTNRTSLPNLPERLGSTNMDLQTNSELWYCTNVWGRDEFFNCFPGNGSQYLEIKTWNLVIMKFASNFRSHDCQIRQWKRKRQERKL